MIELRWAAATIGFFVVAIVSWSKGDDLWKFAILGSVISAATHDILGGA